MKKYGVRFWHHIIAGLVLALGLAIVLIGHLASDLLTQTLGTALAGAAIGHWLSMIFSHSPVDDLSRMVVELRTLPLAGIKPDANIIVQWTHLYMLRVFRGEQSWVHDRLEYSKPISGGVFTATFRTTPPRGDKRVYKLEVEQRDDRLLLFVKVIDLDEPVAVAIFPTFFEGVDEPQAGLAIIYNYENRHRCIPVMLSKAPLKGVSKSGKMDAEHFGAMQSLWIERGSDLVEAIPRSQGDDLHN